MLDIIMPCWINDQETLDLTQAAIDSLKVAPVRLILIDNGSTVGSDYLRHEAGIYIRNPQNLGYAKAVNQGLKLAGDIVAVANNDIRVSPNWYEVLKGLTYWQVPTSIHLRMIPYDEPFAYGDEVWETGKERWCSSSFFVMPNGQQYDEHFLNSCDDWDFWLRWRRAGYHTAYTNRACYQHKDSHSQQKVANRAENDERNYAYFKQKWGEEPGDLFARDYPNQVLLPWRPFP